MIPEKIEGFCGRRSVQEFGDWIEYLSRNTFEENEIIELPRPRIYNAYYYLTKESGIFQLYENSGYRGYRIYLRDFPILFFETDGTVYKSEVSFDRNDKMFYLKKWTKVKNLIDVSRKTALIINMPYEIHAILGTINPYAYKYAEINNYPKEAFIIAPELELLSKAGYSFANRLLACMRYDSVHTLETQEINKYNRLVNNGGKNIKEIFKTDKCVYSILKNEESLEVWDNFRRMYKKGRLKAQDIEEIYNGGYSERQLKQIDEILRKKDGDKPFFTLKTLLRYLEKIDRYEAIDFYEGIDLLRDYLSMCVQLEIKPNLASDSLKREHDVTARIFRTRRDEVLDKKMQTPCAEAAKYNYNEGVFFIRSIEGYDDLVDEAMQQRNCVASYGEAIANRRSMVFVLRQNKQPDKSIATVELTKTGEIRQAKLAYNRPVTNKAQNDFLKRWRKHVLDIMHGEKMDLEEENGQFVLAV